MGQTQSVQASVFVGGGCSASTLDTSATLLVPLYPGCVAAANAVLADGADVEGTRDGFAFKKGVAAPAANMTSDVVLPAWTAPGVTTLTASNLPSGYLSVSGSLYMIANGATFPARAAPGSDTINSMAGQSFATATGFADAYQSFVRTVDDTSGQVES